MNELAEPQPEPGQGNFAKLVSLAVGWRIHHKGRNRPGKEGGNYEDLRGR